MLKNKRGSLQDIGFMIGVLLAASIMILIGFLVVSRFNAEIQSNDNIPALAKANVAELESFYPGAIDNSFLLLTVGLAIVTIVLAALVRISPIFLVLYILGLVFVIFIAGAVSNIYQTMAANTQVVALANQLTFIGTIMGYLPLIVGVIGSVLAIVMFKSWRETTA